MDRETIEQILIQAGFKRNNINIPGITFYMDKKHNIIGIDDFISSFKLSHSYKFKAKRERGELLFQRLGIPVVFIETSIYCSFFTIDKSRLN